MLTTLWSEYLDERFCAISHTKNPCMIADNQIAKNFTQTIFNFNITVHLVQESKLRFIWFKDQNYGSFGSRVI